jgi:hypothetical protein
MPTAAWRSTQPGPDSLRRSWVIRTSAEPVTRTAGGRFRCGSTHRMRRRPRGPIVCDRAA